MSKAFEEYGVGSKTGKRTVDVPYSEEYRRFRKSEQFKSFSFYERCCHVSARILSASVKGETRERLDNAITITHLDIEPEEVYSLTYITSILTLLVGIAFTAFFFSIYSVIGTFSAVALVYYLVKRIPITMLNRWRAKASDQLVTAVLYMIIDLQRGSNLERAMYFTAQQVGPPLSLDFLRLLWGFQVNRYATVQEALENYTVIWRGQEDQFVDAIHLIISSIHQDRHRAEDTLNKAKDVILEGVQDHMMHFAHKLQGPVQALHMLGIVLPVLCLVMLPLIASFLRVPGYYLIILFDVVIPIVIYILAKNILAMRPGGIAYTGDPSLEKGEKTKGILSAVGVFLLFGAIAFTYVLVGRSAGVEFSRISNGSFYLSLIGTTGIGSTALSYLYFRNKEALKVKRKVQALEGEFSTAIFQLGSRIDEGTPPELAFGRVAEDTKGMEISNFFQMIDYNMRVKGTSMEAAIFGNNGAARLYASPMVSSVMRLLIESSKKSLKATASSLLTLSRYLRDTSRVQQRLKDLLADTISSMEMQAGFFVAIITSIVVGLSVLIVTILSALDGVFRGPLSEIGKGAVEGSANLPMGSSSGLEGIAKIFNASNAMPAWQFQLMTGIYLILVVLLLSYVLALVIYGGDAVERRTIMISNLFKSIIIYCVGLLIIHAILSSITKGIIEGITAV